MKFRPTYLYGYASAIVDFCTFVNNRNYSLPSSIKSVITTSEVLTPSMRKLIENCTGVKVFNEYGCGEVGSIAHECEAGNLHTMDDNLIVEVDNTDGKSGELIVTDLYNYATPLIRYRVRDYATKSNSTCSCGRQLGLLTNCLLYTSDAADDP